VIQGESKMGKKRRREGERGGERERVCESEYLMTELKTISQCIRFVLTILQFVNDVTYIWTYLVLPSTGYFLRFQSFKSALLENRISSMGVLPKLYSTVFTCYSKAFQLGMVLRAHSQYPFAPQRYIK